MKYATSIWIVSITCVAMQVGAAEQTVDLRGTWSFQLDDNHVGQRERWFEKDLLDEIRLPGSTDEAGFGVKSEPDPVRLTREHRYVGPAWYQKTIEVPASWKGKHVVLFLERAMWETKVWFDDHYIGMQDSLCVPHRFDLSDYLTPGRHRLTLCIDNRLKINVGHEPARPERGGWSRMWAMSLTEESQGNWNGAIGRIELQATDPVSIERVEAHPDIDKKETRVTAWVHSRVGAVSGEVRVSASCGEHRVAPVTATFRTKDDGERSAADDLSPVLGDLGGDYYERRALTRVDVNLPFGEGAKPWDEFSPNVYQLEVELTGSDEGGKTYRDKHRDTFGLRKFAADGNQLKLNGRTVFLRGNQDNCIHPKTAYPPMDKAAWLAFLQKHEDYGLNCMRFHSWCPPEAAFEAADELGMFVHVESPLWAGGGRVGHLPERAAFIRYESERILDEYGNHPSFVMMATGNELGDGKELYLQYLVEVWRARDNRHLYTCTSQPFDQSRNDDFFVAVNAIGGIARDLKHKNGDAYFNYEDTVGGINRPYISHEIGQYTSFPDFYSWFNEEKYTGPLKAPYIGMLKEKFESLHPAERGPKFAKASGALQVLSYKTEIEAMLRTPSLDGFHLNGLMDYPGEGIALIGMLDAMGDSKGLITPEHFRRFCSETVALAAIQEDELTGGSLFEADAMVRHHGPTDIAGALWLWSISDQSGTVLFEGNLGSPRVATGGLTSLGKIEANLPNVTGAKELTLMLRMDGSEVMNEWSFWVYPAEVDVAIPEGVTFANVWSSPVRETLENGGNGLLALDDRCLVDPVFCHFWTVFWGRGLFPQFPRPMGIYCDPAHRALAEFPTRSHSQFQWYSLLMGSFAMNLNNLPFDFEPVVCMIDDFNECERLGLVFEANVGTGRLLVTTLNLGTEGSRTPAQKQMLKSLLDRAGSGGFAPAQSLTLEQLDQVFQPPKVKVIGVSSANPSMEKENMQDGDPETFWHTQYQPDFAEPPHYVVFEVPADTSVTGLAYVAWAGGNGNGHVKGYSVCVSDDGNTWDAPLIKGTLKPKVYKEQQIVFPAPISKRFIKFEVTDAVSIGGQPLAAIGELDVLVE
ncbi:MAG TPA: discoidin domain-containing protein [Thermoguttaceae bacterium]|nr:discoidin domain-containing protein [Thermoguttaceae bacterium]